MKIKRQFGFCFVNDMPATPEATETILTAIGPIRNTHYGKVLTDVLAIKDV